MISRLLILADDLTGALDSGVQFAKNSIDVQVLPSPETADLRGLRDSAVLVVNTGTRHSSPEEAYSVVTATAKVFASHSFFYKKTDSCLRGNIGAELEALMKATGCSRLPFAPAFPALKRFTRQGYQYLDAQLIHKSSMAKDSLNPITESFIPAIIARQSSIPVRLLTQKSAIPEPQNQREILVFDGETNSDIKNTANLLYENDLLRVSAGCAGFAEALMHVLALDKKADENSFKPIDNYPILIISGSLHQVSIEQVKAAQNNDTAAFGLPGERILGPGWLDSKEAETLAENCSRCLLEKGISILGTEASLGMSRTKPEGSTEDISYALGEMVLKIIEKTGNLHLIVFGGDTLLGIVKTLRCKSLRPLDEIKPGIVLAKAEGQKSSGFLITKAGAFGEKTLIAAIAKYFGREAGDARV